jgi:uncharacterized protein (DUF3820 family)
VRGTAFTAFILRLLPDARWGTIHGMSEELQPDREAFIKLSKAVMPFGKYAGRRLVSLPEPYVLWFKRKGFPKGELGRLLETVYAVKVNGLEHLFRESARTGGHEA